MKSSRKDLERAAAIAAGGAGLAVICGNTGARRD
jgi:hypothetical protein